MNRPCVLWGVASRVHDGEVTSGDDFVVRSVPHGLVVAVVDGLGYGKEAATAARTGLAALEANGQDSLTAMMMRCHERMRGTRGAALSLACFDTRDDTMTWIGVGNVEGVLWRANPGDQPRSESLLLRGGVVGLQLPSLQMATVRVRSGDTLVLATDGVREGFRVGVGHPPQKIADTILAEYAKGTDDALVFAARYLGRES